MFNVVAKKKIRKHCPQPFRNLQSEPTTTCRLSSFSSFFNQLKSFLCNHVQVLISPLIIYPAYKWGWKFLCLLPAYIVGTEIWLFVVSYQSEYKAVRFFM